jgi:hypothetical protein
MTTKTTGMTTKTKSGPKARHFRKTTELGARAERDALHPGG